MKSHGSRKLLGERMPRLLEHLDSYGLPPEVLACDFMLSLGCRALPPTTVLRCWDLLFLEGGDILHYILLAVLMLAEVCVYNCVAHVAIQVTKQVSIPSIGLFLICF